MASRQQQAASQAFLRYSPQEFALTQLLAEAKGLRRSTIHNAAAGAQAVLASTRAARAPVRGVYHDAGITRQQANQDTNATTAGLTGAGVDAIKAAIAREQGASRTKVGLEQANALDELSRRGVEAQSGAAYARTQADRQYTVDSQKIGAQAFQLAGEKGAFTDATLNTLAMQARADARQRRSDARLQRQTTASITGVDPLTGKPTATQADREARRAAAARKAAQQKKTGGLTPTQISDRLQRAQTGVGYATEVIHRVKQLAPNVSRAELAHRLVLGLPLQTEIDAQTGRPPTSKTTKVKTHDVLSIKATNQLWVSIALDLAFDGHISRHNQALLQQLHVSPGRAGWNTQSNPYTTGQKSRG